MAIVDDYDDEWEYEYDENETESFYVTLDMSHVPPIKDESALSTPDQPAVGNPTLIQSRLRRQANTTKGVEIITDGPEGAESTPVANMQIVDLHTPNPLIKYDGRLLRCSWASTVGTDLYFVKPSANKDGADAPLRSLPGVDLLAVGSARLMATAAVLEPRDDVAQRKRNVTRASAATNHPVAGPMDGVVTNTGIVNVENIESESDSTDSSVDSTEEPSGADAVDEEVDTSARSKRAKKRASRNKGKTQETVKAPTPGGFLARLNEAKAKRGDKTQLVINSTSVDGRIVSESVEAVPTKAKKNRKRKKRKAATGADTVMEDAN